MNTKQITTKHGVIGYTNNIEIVEEALRTQFMFDDQSHVLKAVAAHIWSHICTQGSDEKHWGAQEVMMALAQCQTRLNAMMEKMKCTRPGCAISYPHVKHEPTTVF